MKVEVSKGKHTEETKKMREGEIKEHTRLCILCDQSSNESDGTDTHTSGEYLGAFSSTTVYIFESPNFI